MTVAEKIKSWLDEIGADGLIKPDWEDGPIAITPDDFVRDKAAHLHLQLVPAFRHADGSYHTKPEASHDEHCPCICQAFKDWNKHKEATK